MGMRLWQSVIITVASEQVFCYGVSEHSRGRLCHTSMVDATGFRCVLCFMGCDPLPMLSAEVAWNGVTTEKTRGKKSPSRDGSGVTWGASGVEWGEMGGGGRGARKRSE
jgi:hypothetical protein